MGVSLRLTDISHVEDLTVRAPDDRVVARELDIDGGPAEVATHGEVGNRCNHGDGGGDVVEDTVLARLRQGETDEDEGRDGHDSRDGPVPVGSMGRDGNVSL